MQVNEWGPSGWKFLHTITFNYTPSDDNKIKYKLFFKSLDSVLPCPYCCESFSMYANALPIEEYLDSREGLTYWLYCIHNLVNQKLCKRLVSFKEIVIEYEKIKAKCGKITNVNKVEIKTCQIKQKENIDINFIDKFVNDTFNKYKELTNNYIKKLFDNNDNPNKESLDEYCKH
jgi:hypothetical protein